MSVCHLCLNTITSEYLPSPSVCKKLKKQLNYCLPMIENISNECVLCQPCSTTVKLAYEFKQEYLEFQKSIGIENEDHVGTYGIFDYINNVMRGKQDNSKVATAKQVPQHSRIFYTTIKDQQGDKIFSCNFCRFDALSKNIIKLHVQHHQPETTYCCNFCEFKTNHFEDYKTHIGGHFGTNCYVCNLCQFTTANIGVIEQHMTVHSEPSALICRVCEFQASDWELLVKHLRNHVLGKAPTVEDSTK